jgi:hypothetical protein
MELEDLLQCQNSPHSLSILDQIFLASFFFNINFNITFPNIRVGSKWPFSFRFPDQDSVYISPLFLIRATCSAPPSLLYFVTGPIFAESYKAQQF